MNGFNAEKLCISPERMAYIRRYLSMLNLTLIEALVLIKESSNSLSLLFAAKIIAIACSRLPEVGEVVFTALRDLQKERPCPFADIRFDIFNEDEKESESYHQQHSSPTLDLENISPSLSNSIPKSFSMTAFPSDIQESFQDWALTQSESYDSEDEYSSSSYSGDDTEEEDEGYEDDREEEEEEEEDREEEDEDDSEVDKENGSTEEEELAEEELTEDEEEESEEEEETNPHSQEDNQSGTSCCLSFIHRYSSRYLTQNDLQL